MSKHASSFTSPPPSVGQIPSLDGIRALAVLLVIFGHTEISPIIPGGFGVTVFFFLSGFLITSLLQREYHSQGRLALPRFYARRLLRLMPSLIATLIAAVTLVWLGAIPGRIDALTLLSQIFFFFNYLAIYGDRPQIESLGILWSLSVEEHFYLLWPSLFLLWMKGHLRLPHMIASLLVILGWRLFRLLVWGDNEWTIYSLTDTRLDGMAYGCLLALLMPRQLQAPKAHGAVMPVLIAIGLGLLLFSFAWQNEVFRSSLRYSLQGLALMPLFFYAVRRPDLWIFRPLNWAWMRRLGLWSYSLYLIHMVVLQLLQNQPWAPQNPWMMTALVLGLSCLWSALIYEVLEKPLLPLRRRLSLPPSKPRATKAPY